MQGISFRRGLWKKVQVHQPARSVLKEPLSCPVWLYAPQLCRSGPIQKLPGTTSSMSYFVASLPLGLVDVTVMPDDEIAGHRSMAALTLLQKHIHQRDLAELVDGLAPILLAGYLSSSQIISLVHYIMQFLKPDPRGELFIISLQSRHKVPISYNPDH